MVQLIGHRPGIPMGNGLYFSSNMDDWREDYQTYGHNFEIYMINSDGSGFFSIDRK